MQILFNRSTIGAFFFLIGLVFFNNLPSHAQQVSKQSTWQQQCDYDIDVKLDDKLRQLNGKIKMTYTNNSPETLREIYIHLWPNAYKNNETPFAQQQVQNGSLDFHFSPDSCRGYIDSLSFFVNGIKTKLINKDTKYPPYSCWNNSMRWASIDVVRLDLPMPLAPGDICTIETPFRVQIPKVFSRMGWGYDKESNAYDFNMTQWYPKPAVYDVTGWNPMPYLDQGEFYSEFGTFNVKITVPQKYVVAATGNEQSKIDNADGTTTSIYKQAKVHDFAWFANPNFKVVSEDIIVNDGRKITSKVYYVYSNTANEKQQAGKNAQVSRALKTIKNTIEFLGTHVGEYPYDVVTVVQGPLLAGGGMEYPTITVMPSLDPTTIEHEVGHNWFYGILGSNEREHPWMDEGINSFYEDWYKNRKDSNNAVVTWLGAKGLGDIDQHYLLYQLQQFAGLDQPIEGHAADYTEANYGAIVYGKTALAFNYLREYLGNDMMDKCMNAYYNTWKFKHPLPGDIKEVFEKESGKNLDWFFNTLIGTTNTVDYKLVKAKQKNDKLYITVENKGGIESPIFINTKDKSGLEKSYTFDGFDGRKTFEVPSKNWQWVKLDTGHYMMETNLRNNTKGKGLSTGLHIKMIGVGLSNTNYVYLNPVISANKYDGLLLGCMFSNELVPMRSLQYTFVPLFGFRSKQLVGMADVTKFIKVQGKQINRIEVGANFRQFGTGTIQYSNPTAWLKSYSRTDLYIKLLFSKKHPRVLQDRSLRMGILYIGDNEKNVQLKYNFINVNGYPYLEFNSKDNSKLNPVNLNVKSYLGSVNRLQATVNGHFNFSAKKKLYYRFFGGVKKSAYSNLGGLDNFYPAGNSGMQDFTYDYMMPARNEQMYNNLWSHQVLTRDGNMHIPLSMVTSDQWLTAANMELPLPGKIPFNIYADLSFYNILSHTNGNPDPKYTRTSLYSVGLSLPLFSRTLIIYIPLLNSSSINTYFENNFVGASKATLFLQKISFVLDLSKLNLTNRKYISLTSLGM